MQGLEIEEDIKCSACGKQFDIWDKQEDFSFDKHIGYGSKYDEKHIKFQLCCDCFDKIFDKVKPMIINIQIEDCDAWAGEKAVDIDAEYLEKITIKNESLEKLIALNEKIFMLFTQYFINYYKYNHLEFMLYSDKNRDYKAEILNLILEAKQSVELTENDYNQSLFFNGFSAKIDEFTFKLVKILSKMQYKEPIFAFLSNENYLKIFIDYYNCVAD